MPLKEISEVFQNFSAALSNQTMTGTATLTSAVSNIKYKDSVSMQFQWTGTPNGTFVVQGSLDYIPTVQQSGGTPNAGTWIPIPVKDVSGNPPIAAGAAGQILCNLNQLGFPWIRVQYTNTSSTGVLTGYISAKSLG